MDMFDFRARNYMNPGNYGSNFNVATGAGPWATPSNQPKPFTGMQFQGPRIPEPPQFTGMEIQGPLNSFARQPEPEPPPQYRGMEVQGPLGSTPGRPNYEAPEPPEVQMPGQAGNQQGGQVGEDEEDNGEFDIFKTMYNAPTPALEAYKRHIMSMPQQQDYRAGKMDRVAAALAGVSESMRKGGGAGFQAAKGIVDQRYNQALQNYANQGQGLSTLAELESQDMKGKMGYAKTMMEQRRADAKEIREGLRDAALNKLTDAQIGDLNLKLKTTGKSIVDNPATGEKEIVSLADGSRTTLGKFLQTAEEKADLDVRTHGRKTDIDVKGDVSKARQISPINVAADVDRARQISPITEQREKNLLSFGEPLKAQTNLDLFNAKAPVTLANQMRLREHQAANPIPSSGFDQMQPSQTDIAFDYGTKRAAQERPEFYKFLSDEPRERERQAANNQELYTEFKALAQKYNDEAILAGKRKSVGGAGGTVTTPPAPAALPIRQSPISAPSAPDDPLRAQAVELLKTNKPEMANNETAIAQVIAQLRGQ